MHTTPSQDPNGPSNLLSSQPILLQYLFFLALCAIETASFHMPIRSLLSSRLPRPFSAVVPHYPHTALISTALLVSSFTKLFPLLLLVWNYDLPSSASAVSWAVIINNVAALEILLDCGYVRAALLAAVGAVCLYLEHHERKYLTNAMTVHFTRGWRGRRRCCCWGRRDGRCD
jgi:hypothetical protein